MATQRLIPWEKDIEQALTFVEQALSYVTDERLRQAIRSLVNPLRDLSKWVGQEVDDLRKDISEPAPSTGPQGSTIISGLFTPPPPTSTAGFSEMRHESDLPAIAGSMVVKFKDGELFDANYSLYVNIANAANDHVGFRVTSKSTEGFNLADVYEAGTLEYIAVR